MKKSVIIIIAASISILLAQIPDWEWAVNSGGLYDDYGKAVCTDIDGNVYFAGFFAGSANFNSVNVTSNGDKDIFIVKLDVNGNYHWLECAGGIGYDTVNSITTDTHGNVYVTGRFQDSIDFGSINLGAFGYNDIFVAKLDSSGNWLWAVKAGGIYWDEGFSISIDSEGNSYVTGSFAGTASFGAINLSTSTSTENIFVAKLDADGEWLWAKGAGGSGWDRGTGIGIGTDENIYITGYFGLYALFGSNSLMSNGSFDVFVAKMDTNGNWLWLENAGGIGYDEANALVIDNDCNILITGKYQDSASFGDEILNSSLYYDNIFVSKLDSDGEWLWAKGAGGIYHDAGKAISSDISGNVYITGFFRYFASFGSFDLSSTSIEYSDIFAAKLDIDGNWIWARNAGSESEDHGLGITINTEGNLFVTGRFEENASFGSNYLNSEGYSDIFIAKIRCNTLAVNELIPADIRLSNYPNPFNPSTTINFSIDPNEQYELSIYNLKGQIVKTFLVNSSTDLPINSVTWNGDDDSGEPVTSGVYLYKLKSGNTEISKKMLLMK
ncbi:SBBP repeat-containing protein [Candidatus Cloacimonadota bacterium]